MRGKQWDLSSGTKPCPACAQEKPLNAFGKSKYTANGLSVYCLACMAEKARARRATPEGKAAHRASTERWVAQLSADGSDGVKTCPKCLVEKPFAEYPKNRRTKHGIGSYCSLCSVEMVRGHRETPEGAQAHRDASKRWRDANKERHKDNNARWQYGLAPGAYNALLAAQGGKCAICESAEPGKGLTRFHIDHCHTTKAIRGLLCEHCNRGLGHFRDNPARLRRAASYVEVLPERSVEGGS